MARDDTRHEIIVVFRVTHELSGVIIGTKTGNFFVGLRLKFENADLMIPMNPLQTTGVVDVGDSYVHFGFLLAYNWFAQTILDTINSQVAAYPSYKIIMAGYSLGGAVASITALLIKAAVPNTPLKLFTYGGLIFFMPGLSNITTVGTQGQHRTGNSAFVSLVESRIGTSNIFRVVHTYGIYFHLRF